MVVIDRNAHRVHRTNLMEIEDDRHGAPSTLMISQLPTDQWYASIGDNTLADAILDRPETQGLLTQNERLSS